MRNRIASLALLIGIGAVSALAQNQPLRIFIRSSEKTHGAPDNGAHDYPAFLDLWTKFLASRGAVVNGAKNFPTAEQLAATDVLINYSSDGANHTPEERARFEQYLKNGGGVVVIHDGMCGDDPLWYAALIGGAKQHGERNSYREVMKFHIEDPSSPILKGISDFDFDDEMFYLLRPDPGMHVLASTADPNGKIVPQLWTFEKTLPGGKPYRSFVSLEGHWIKNFDSQPYQTILLRGIAWAGKRPLDTLTKTGK